LASRSHFRRPALVRSCAGSSSPRASPKSSSSASSVAFASATISRAIRSSSRFASRLAFAASFVPSIATTPVPTSPAFAHSPSTEPNSPANAASWRTRKRAIVAWSGTRLAQITR
jgi:hypothetical protein